MENGAGDSPDNDGDGRDQKGPGRTCCQRNPLRAKAKAPAETGAILSGRFRPWCRVLLIHNRRHMPDGHPGNEADFCRPTVLFSVAPSTVEYDIWPCVFEWGSFLGV